ncbi:MAG: response regulator transcription factor [Coriobacteriia bacterium]|nr:response regulator transcription factor [Coriobacteriia bacterium]
MRILLVEDDDSLRKGIELKLAREGHEVLSADTVAAALELLTKQCFELAILDISLPDGSGLDVCQQIRAESPDTYILMLTARDTEMDIVTGYDMGADDYLTKPFSVSVLTGKVNAVARRAASQAATTAAGSREIVLDTSRQQATVRGITVSLTRNELRLLGALLANTGQVLSKSQLLQALWDIDGDYVDENTLAVNIRRLREKVEADPSHPTLIETVRNIGYRLNGGG